MPRIVNIDADAEPVDLSIEALEAEAEDAQKAFDKLISERHKKREKLSKSAFRSYNEDTADVQIAAQERVASADKALSRALGRTEQRVAVGPATEAGEAGS